MVGRVAKRIALILRLPVWVGVYVIISNPFLASLVFFLGIIGFILISWGAYFVWSIVFYQILSNREAVERARKNLTDGENRRLFWRVARFIQAKLGVLVIYFFFLALGPVFSVPLVKVGGRGNLRDDLPILIFGSFLAAPPLLLLSLGLATFTPIPHWIWEFVKGLAS